MIPDLCFICVHLWPGQFGTEPFPQQFRKGYNDLTYFCIGWHGSGNGDAFTWVQLMRTVEQKQLAERGTR
jgi:hypothetical protein